MEGISYLTSVTVAGSGTLTNIELFRKSFSRLTILRSYAGGKTTDWELAWPEVVVGDITTTTNRRYVIQLNTDGRIYNGLTAEFWVHSENSSGGAVTDYLSLIDTGQLMSLLNAVPGYTVTDIRPAGYAHIPISYIGCGGGWSPLHGQSSVELEVAGGADLYGADLYSVLTLGGGVGDIADLTSAGDPLVRCVMSLRGAASATVINPEGPEVGDTVKLGSSGANGTGTTDSQGYAKTGTPNAPTNATRAIAIHRASGTDPSDITPRTLVRWITKSAWYLGSTVTSTGVALAFDLYGQMVRLKTTSTGFVAEIRHPGTAVGSWSSAATTSASSAPTYPGIAWIGTDKLIATYQLSDKAVSRISTDDGATWSDELTMFTGGKYPRPASEVINGNFGNTVVLAYVSGKIKGKLMGSTGSWGSEFTCKDDAGVDLAPSDADFGFSWSATNGHPWELSFTVSGESVISHWVSYDECLTWKKVS
jgi:hypothetical protein